MPFVTLGTERFTLAVGQTRVGGTGDDALPFVALRRVPTVALLFVDANGSASVWPHGRYADVVTVDGRPLGADPLPVVHGAKIGLFGLCLVFYDGRETGITGPMTKVGREQFAVPDASGTTAAIPEDGQLVRHATETVVAIPDSGLVIGRDADSDLVVSGIEVSRRHAVLRRSARGYVLTDVSKNGTYLNGRRIEGTRVLRVGDVIRIGEEDFRFEAGGVAYDSAPTPPAPRVEPLVEPQTTARLMVGLWRRLAGYWPA